ncbi:ribonuclease R [Mycoplasma phocoeninasale]|uniref:Ribonuclease R n=1 Tax=Mycoplasma phocoeninasale TaxID=2726117 RepID=A0A858U2C8_9MOLU|nr:ribonuclease R [Mycoplasma phocoeninasale]QJG66630.1 ribonuclease R [Mycoplasma phocoeninasale]
MTYTNDKQNDKNSEISKQKVLDLISEKRELSFVQIARILRIPPQLNNKLTTQINELIKENLIEENRDKKYIPIYFLFELEGTISITNKRLGFLDFEINSESKSAFLNSKQLRSALDGDLVLAKIYYYYDNEGNKLYKANLIKVLKHNKKIVIGTINRFNNKLYFNAFDDRNKANFSLVNDKNIPSEILTTDLVSCEVLEPDLDYVKVSFKRKISSLNNEDYNIEKIMASHDVSKEFDLDVLEYTKTLPTEVSESEISSRVDLRNLMTVTIDGLDTKDFDDAISCYKLENGNWKLFIHIADVSYYVKEGDPIDNEALARGTSIYLPDKVIPMLPFELSNGICSLNPNVLRNCITLETELDDNGNNIDSKIYASVIESNYRLTYDHVNQYFKNQIEIPVDVSKLLDSSRQVAQILKAKKESQGYVDFEIKESKVIMKDNKVVDIVVKEEGESEKLIEHFMIHANETVAEIMIANKIPSIFRVHDKPSDDKLYALQELLNFSNMKDIAVPRDGDPRSFAEMIEKIKSKSFDDYLKMAMLKTMQKAIYSSKNIGHFGLGSKAYSHFTSPIRRYPDLLLHRLIRNYIFMSKPLNEDGSKILTTKIEEIATRNSESEKIAMTVERDIVDIRKAEFFDKLINQEFEATLTNIEKFGTFFNIEKYQTSVLIRFENMDGNVVKVNDFLARGNSIALNVGKKYKIRITSIDREKGNINAMLA